MKVNSELSWRKGRSEVLGDSDVGNRTSGAWRWEVRGSDLPSAGADTGSSLPGSFRACGSPALSSPECPPLHEDGPVTAQHRPSGSGACLRRLRLSSCVGYGRC